MKERIAIIAIDRTGWDPGPWDDEEDRAEWWTPQGYPALILRNGLGCLCGYVAIPPKHPGHGVNYDTAPVEGLIVHGGLSYSNSSCGPIRREVSPEEQSRDWWLGFDCAHAFDVSPGLRAAIAKAYDLTGKPRTFRIPLLDPKFCIYRDMKYVKAECESLATQLKALR